MSDDARGSAVTGGESQSALKLRGLVKTYGAKRVVNGVNLTVPAGAFWQDPLRAKGLVGLLPDGLALPERLTGRELLTYMGLMRGLDQRTANDRAEELLNVLDLAAADRTLVIDYSTGMRKKVGLAVALLQAPRLLVLDEPFEAVDPVSAATIRDILRRFVDGGWAAPWAWSLLPAALGGGVGVIVLVSVFALVPMADPKQRARSAAGGDGSVGLVAWATLPLSLITVLAAAVFPLVGMLVGSTALPWVGVPVGGSRA